MMGIIVTFVFNRYILVIQIWKCPRNSELTIVLINRLLEQPYMLRDYLVFNNEIWSANKDWSIHLNLKIQ